MNQPTFEISSTVQVVKDVHSGPKAGAIGTVIGYGKEFRTCLLSINGAAWAVSMDNLRRVTKPDAKP